MFMIYIYIYQFLAHIKSETLWYLSLNPVVGHFGTNNELKLGKCPIKFHSEFMLAYDQVPLLGSD